MKWKVWKGKGREEKGTRKNPSFPPRRQKRDAADLSREHFTNQENEIRIESSFAQLCSIKIRDPRTTEKCSQYIVRKLQLCSEGKTWGKG